MPDPTTTSVQAPSEARVLNKRKRKHTRRQAERAPENPHHHAVGEDRGPACPRSLRETPSHRRRAKAPLSCRKPPTRALALTTSPLLQEPLSSPTWRVGRCSRCRSQARVEPSVTAEIRVLIKGRENTEGHRHDGEYVKVALFQSERYGGFVSILVAISPACAHLVQGRIPKLFGKCRPVLHVQALAPRDSLLEFRGCHMVGGMCVPNNVWWAVCTGRTSQTSIAVRTGKQADNNVY